MAYVVTENCQRCRFTECVSVCPVECFHFDDSMTYIDPTLCIDCGGCVPACPVNAIYEQKLIPAHLAHWVAINRERSATYPVLSKRLEPLPGAQERRQELGF